MDVLFDAMPVSNNESSDTFVLSNPSQPLSECALPLPLDHHFLVQAPTKAGSWVNCSSPAMPVTNTGTVVLLVPCLNCSQQPFPTNQFDFQDIGLDQEYFPGNLSEPQTLDNYIRTATPALQALPPAELSTVAIGGMPSSTFDCPAVIGPQTPQPTNSFAAGHYSDAPSSPSLEGLQASPCHKDQRSECPLLNCEATFKRVHDLKRHIDTVHGVKDSCPYSSCRFKTGRKDKMAEHARKMHGKA